MCKLKSTQQAYSTQAFQNGMFSLPKIPSRGKRLCLQDKSKRCLFLSATVYDLKKVCEIRLFGKHIRASLPLFWTRECSQDFFKAFEDSNSSTEAVKHSSSDVSRQYSFDDKDVR